MNSFGRLGALPGIRTSIVICGVVLSTAGACRSSETEDSAAPDARAFDKAPGAPSGKPARGSANGPSAALPLDASPPRRAQSQWAGAVEVKLLEAGREPHRTLRYRFRKGSVERFKLVNTTELALGIDGHPAKDATAPEIELRAAIKVIEVRADGSARREINVERVRLADGAKLPANVRTEFEQALLALGKIKCRDVIDVRGRLAVIEIDASRVQNPQVKQLVDSMQQSFVQVGAALPEQPLGVGGKWQVISAFDQAGMHIDQRATYVLTELDGDTGRADVSLEQSSPRGPFQAVGAPADTTTELISMQANGSGEIAFDLRRTIPSGQLATRANALINTRANGKNQSTKMTMTIRVRFIPERG